MIKNIKKYYRNNQAGFTLIELILYMALVSIFISGAILFAWDVIYGQAKSQVQLTVNHNLRFSSQRILYEIRNASDINSVSGSTISLSMSDPARNPTIFDLSAGQLRIGYGSGGNCPTTSPCSLTNDQISVTSLNFTDLSSGVTSKNIKFDITVESTADKQEWQKQQSYTGTVELRSN